MTQSICREGTGPGTLKSDPGKSLTPIDQAKAKGSQIPSLNPEMKWNSPPLLKPRTNMGKGVSEASSDAMIPAQKQSMQAQVTLVDEKPRMHEDASMVVVQNDEMTFEVDDLDVHTDDEPPECNVEQEGREKAVWNLYRVARPKRHMILRQMATDSAQDVISRVKWTLDHEQQFKVYLTILKTLAANYADLWG
jgi:hypothetical protein